MLSLVWVFTCIDPTEESYMGGCPLDLHWGTVQLSTSSVALRVRKAEILVVETGDFCLECSNILGDVVRR